MFKKIHRSFIAQAAIALVLLSGILVPVSASAGAATEFVERDEYRSETTQGVSPQNFLNPNGTYSGSLDPLYAGGIFTDVKNDGILMDDADHIAAYRFVTVPPATLTVTKLTDTNDGVCDTDCSLREAMINANDGDTIKFGVSGTVVLGSVLPVINNVLIIDGSGGTIALDGANGYRIFTVLEAGNLTVKNLTFQNGEPSTPCEWDTSLPSCGGAIYTNGDLTVANSTFTRNTAARGGAIMAAGYAKAVNIENSTFSNNLAVYHGGAVFNLLSQVNIKNSTFYGNTAGDWGGGILNDLGSLTLYNNTFSSNSAARGAGAYNSAGDLAFANNILANSVSGDDCFNEDPYATISSNVHNLIEANAAAPNNCGTPALNADPKLASLANNGGTTQTMSLLSGSPAIDAGDDISCQPADQRGVTRPQGSHCDMGAFEYEFPPTPTELIITSDSPDPSEIEGWVTVSILVSNIGEGVAQPTGVVHITGADTNCDMILNHGTGSCNVRFDTAGDKVISAFYEGDVSHLASSNDQPHRVQIWPTTLTILSDSPDPLVTNGFFALAVEVTGGRILPTGTVNVVGDGVSCTIPLSMGKGNCLLSFSTIGQKTLTATYNGDNLHLPSMDTEFHQVVQGIPTVPPPPITFADVPVTHLYYQDIEILYANGLTGGCNTSPLKYCPDQIMNRGQAAVFMLRANFGSSYVPPAPTHIFQDDWSRGAWAESWADAMWTEGLSGGCQTNPPKYCPWTLIPREQAVIFALRMKYGISYTPPPATGTVFADMANPSYYATSWAEQAYKDGLIPNCGMSAGKPKICPRELVSRGLAAYMIVRARNLSMP